MISAGQIIHQRRSLLACDGKTSIPAQRFYRMLERVMPGASLPVAERPMPWDAIPWAPAASSPACMRLRAIRPSWES